VTTLVDTEYRPHEYQRDIHEAMMNYRFCVLVCHRRFGKTLCATNSLVDAAIRFEGGDGRFAYCAPLLKQAKKISWVYLKSACLRIEGTKVMEGELEIHLPNGSTIALYGADNPEGMRGLYFDGLVIDEPADMKPYVWDEIIRPALADRQGWAIFIGTPRGINKFYEIYIAAVKSPNWYARIYRIDETDLPWLPDEEIELMKETMSDSAIRQELYCDFNASTDNTLLTISEVVKSMERKILSLDEIKGYPKILSCDPAREGSDKTTIYKRQGPWLERAGKYSKENTSDIVGRLIKIMDEWMPDAVFIDRGEGAGIIDRLRDLRYKVFEVNFGSKANDEYYMNRRAEMWDGMATWVKEIGVLPDLPELKVDLCAPTYNHNNPLNKFALEKKEDIKSRIGKSPDDGDAVALTFAQPVRPKQENHPEVLLRRGAGKRRKKEYVVPWQR